MHNFSEVRRHIVKADSLINCLQKQIYISRASLVTAASEQLDLNLVKNKNLQQKLDNANKRTPIPPGGRVRLLTPPSE